MINISYKIDIKSVGNKLVPSCNGDLSQAVLGKPIMEFNLLHVNV